MFNHRTNVDVNNRLVCYDIKELGKQLKKLGMLIVQDQVWGRVTENRAEGKSTRYYICVMYLGQMIEKTDKKSLFGKPLHPYTKALLSAIPTIDIDAQPERIQLKGEINSPIDPEPGCRFAKRCPYAKHCCKEPVPLQEVEPGHFVACHRVREINSL